MSRRGPYRDEANSTRATRHDPKLVAERAFRPAWAGASAALAELTTMNAAEAAEAMEARGLVPIGFFSDPRRIFALPSASLGDLILCDLPAATVPTPVQPPTGQDLVVRAVIGGLMGLAVGFGMARQRGRQPSGHRLVASALAGVASAVTHDPSALQRASGLPVTASVSGAPRDVRVAATIAALGYEVTQIEELAIEAAARLVGKRPPLVVWHAFDDLDVFGIGPSRARWVGLRKATEAARAVVIKTMPEGAGRERLLARWYAPTSASTSFDIAQAHALAARRYDRAAARGIVDGQNPFDPLCEVWMRGCAVEAVAEQYVEVAVPVWRPKKEQADDALASDPRLTSG